MPSFEVISDVTLNLFRMTGKKAMEGMLKHQQHEVLLIMQGIICPPLLANITSTFYLSFTLKIDFLRRENGTSVKNPGHMVLKRAPRKESGRERERAREHRERHEASKVRGSMESMEGGGKWRVAGSGEMEGGGKWC